MNKPTKLSRYSIETYNKTLNSLLEDYHILLQENSELRGKLSEKENPLYNQHIQSEIDKLPGAEDTKVLYLKWLNETINRANMSSDKPLRYRGFVNYVESKLTPVEDSQQQFDYVAMLRDSHFQWLIPYVAKDRYSVIDYTQKSEKYWKKFQMGIYTQAVQKEIKLITKPFWEGYHIETGESKFLSCPLPEDANSGIHNYYSFPREQIKQLISWIVRDEEAREDYIDIFKMEEAENRLGLYGISKKEADSIHFDLLDKDKFNRFALRTLKYNYSYKEKYPSLFEIAKDIWREWIKK